MASKLLLLRRIPIALRRPHSVQRAGLFSSSSSPCLFAIVEASGRACSPPFLDYPLRNFSSQPSHLNHDKISQGPASIDYSSLLQEDEFHKLADSTIHDLLEKIEEYGDSVEIDGFDIDYGNQVLTVKLGSLGTYVVNKQTPNRQIWMSSPVSGPLRFDWDPTAQAWIYRRTKAELLKTLEDEIEKLCGKPINLS